MILLDTNVLVYASVAGDPRHAACRKAVDEAVRSPREFCLTWVNLFEYLRVVTDLAPVRGDQVFDCRIAAILLENGGSHILSFDTRFRRVRGLRVDAPA